MPRKSAKETQPVAAKPPARNIVEFRLEPGLMEMLENVAEHKATSAGVLARMWVAERLRVEHAKQQREMAAGSLEP